MLKILFFINFITLTFSSFAQEKEILWSEERKLRWEDFQAAHKRSVNSAVSACGVSFYYEVQKDSIYLEIRATFDKSGSWVNPAHKNDTLLRHEQEHFNLTEIYVRKLRKEILLGTFTRKNFDEKLKNLFNEINRQLDERNDLYDRETNHSKNREKQNFWNKIIESELEELKDFKNISFKVKLN